MKSRVVVLYCSLDIEANRKTGRRRKKKKETLESDIVLTAGEEKPYFPSGRHRGVAAVERVGHRARPRLGAVNRPQARREFGFSDRNVCRTDEPAPLGDAVPLGQHVHHDGAAGHVIHQPREVRLERVSAVEFRHLFPGQAQHVLLRNKKRKNTSA